VLVIDITATLGPGATPSAIEAMVKAVRVATDVGRDAELRRIRRAATEQMKYPTDRELSSAIERLPRGAEESLRYRARQLLRARKEAEEMPPELWWDRMFRRQTRRKHPSDDPFAEFYERALAGAPVPWPGLLSIGLDVLDPDLYFALVADQLARQAPGEVAVREVRYRNPFGEVLTAVGTGAEALSKTAGVIDTVATLGSRKRLKKAEADLAESTVDDRIEASRLDLELKREQLRQARIANAMAEEELLAKRIANETLLSANRQALVELLIAKGQLDEADAIAAIESSDTKALMEFAVRPSEIEVSFEPDPDDG
jgi:hypothetical protein